MRNHIPKGYDLGVGAPLDIERLSCRPDHDMKFRLMPTNRDFYVDFLGAAVNLSECVRRLRALLDDLTNAAQLHQAVKEAERKGDELTRAILRRLDESFVTPFDPEDIHRLAEGLDDVVDDVYHVSEMIVLTGITDVIPELLEQVEILDRMASHLVVLFERFESMRGLRGIVDELHGLESEADTVYRRTIARLFSGEFEPLDLIKWKDISASMEEALDGIEDVSDIVGSIIVKHA